MTAAVKLGGGIRTHHRSATFLYTTKSFSIISELERHNKLVLLFLQERLLTLKKQAAQITQQAQREKESFLKERSNLEAMLQRVRGYSCLHLHTCGHPCLCVSVERQPRHRQLDFVFNFCLLGERKPHHAGKEIC